MGFLTIVRKLRQKEKEMKILIIGLDNAGKTTIVKKFNNEPTDTVEPTLGFDIKTLEHRGFNQRGEEIAYCKRTGLMHKRPKA